MKIEGDSTITPTANCPSLFAAGNLILSGKKAPLEKLKLAIAGLPL
jgi:hypothetical protein